MTLLRTGVALAMAFLLSACSAIHAAQQSNGGRLNAFPTYGWPTEHPVTVRWNDHQVPFVEAASDTDLAFALGVVHHHRRAGQMRTLKQISQGRLAEMAGPPVRGIDEALRILDFGYAAPAVVRAWPDETRSFVRAFVDGLNWHQTNAAPPPELSLLGLEPEPWTAEDLVTIGRLAGTDVNWLAFFSALRSRLEPDWPETWQRIKLAGLGPDDAELEGATDVETLAELLAATSKQGSNSLALAPFRSASGAPLLANDPHLGLNLPNLWLLAGAKSPSYHVVGMMIPGLPFFGLGRSPDIAWGGTNARALSSDLVNVAGNGDIVEETVTIDTRWWFDRTMTRRRSPEGPILSDSRFVRARPGEALALRWVGHEPTDEITAFLRAARATNVREFREAFAGYGVSAQNMLVADREGGIAMLMAAKLPKRGPRPPDDFVLQEASNWQGFDTALTMGWVENPAEGFIASANDRPDYIGRPAGYFFSPKDRVNRMAHLVEQHGTLAVDDLFALQTDVVSEPAAAMAAGLVARADDLHLLHPLLDDLRGWDGAYTIESRAPVVFETLLYHLARALYANGDGEVSRERQSWSNLQLFLLADLDARLPQERLDLLQKAVTAAAPDAEPYKAWGDMHRVRVGHLLGNVPVIGGFFRIADLPSAGSRETLMKRSHNLVNGRHRATFGAQSRHVSDLADPDANWFVLFGGQDGWLGSAQFADQIELWREGRYLQLPLSEAGRAEHFPIVMRTTTSDS
ncbi:MAG: penicillin acylase family protein [Pseudomonadota bacterium]